MERDHKAPSPVLPSEVRCPTASAADGEATAPGRPSLTTSLSFASGSSPTARARAACLPPAPRRAAGTCRRGVPRAPAPRLPPRTPGAASPAWDWTGPTPSRAGAAQTPVSWVRAGGVVGHPLLSPCMGAGRSAPNHRSMAQGLHPRTSPCNGLRASVWAGGWGGSAVPPRTAPQAKTILLPSIFLANSQQGGCKDAAFQQLPAHPSRGAARRHPPPTRRAAPERSRICPAHPSPAEQTVPVHLPAGRAPPPAAAALLGLRGQKTPKKKRLFRLKKARPPCKLFLL